MIDAVKSIEELYKDKYGQLISLILHRFRDLSMEAAEDIVQEVFSEAAILWPKQGVPDNPAGWIYQSCRNKSINHLKKVSREVTLVSANTSSLPFEEIPDHIFKDAQLEMLLACCQPNLTPKSQLILALKYVANLKVENIAQQLGLTPDAIEKILYRTRQVIKKERIDLADTSGGMPEQKLAVIHKVIYLMFNVGYKQPGNKLNEGKLICEEALILNKLLLDTHHCNSETKALQSLMLFNSARFDSRFDSNDNAIELEHQDRSSWNNMLIRVACQLLMESEAPSLSPYHLEAAIAQTHCTAQTFEDTNWTAICQYYEALLKIYPSPFAEINYAVALQYDHQVEKAYRILTELSRNPFYRKLTILETSLQKCTERKKLL